MKRSARETGTWYEENAARYLEQQGYKILEKNFRCRQGEIDLIAMDGEYLCFIEVKFRENADCGGPFLAVDNKNSAGYVIRRCFILWKEDCRRTQPAGLMWWGSRRMKRCL